jgi:hypothetical protein
MDWMAGRTDCCGGGHDRTDAKQVVWFHRNETSPWPAILKRQGLESLIGRLQDPLLHRTFGGALVGTGLQKIAPDTLRSAAPGSVSF